MSATVKIMAFGFRPQPVSMHPVLLHVFPGLWMLRPGSDYIKSKFSVGEYRIWCVHTKRLSTIQHKLVNCFMIKLLVKNHNYQLPPTSVKYPLFFGRTRLLHIYVYWPTNTPYLVRRKNNLLCSYYKFDVQPSELRIFNHARREFPQCFLWCLLILFFS